MNNLKDAIKVNVKAFKKTMKSVEHFPIIFISLIVITLINYLANNILARLSSMMPVPFIWGIMSYFVDVVTLAMLVAGLARIIEGRSLGFYDLLDDWQAYINPLLATRFIFWLIEMLLGMLSGTALRDISYLSVLIAYLFKIFVSPMLETVYIGQEEGQDAVVSIFSFLKDNILQWIPVTLALSLLVDKLSANKGIEMILTRNFAKLPITLVFYLLLTFFYIYKGHLYSILHNSSIRKREFMGEFDEVQY